MEKVIPNEDAPIINKINEDDIPRCIDCNLICSLQLNYNDGKPLINFECENNHKGNILLKDYMLKYNKFALSKEKCGICGKNQKEVKGDFIYCTKCKQFLCHSCQLNHKIEDKHNIITYRRYDALCKIHSNTYLQQFLPPFFWPPATWSSFRRAPWSIRRVPDSSLLPMTLPHTRPASCWTSVPSTAAASPSWRT